MTGRRYGIDALKCICMFMVVVLHILGHGGILDQSDGIQNQVAWGMELGAYAAVNTFAMVTGYLMFDKKQRSARLLSTWVQVLFYSIVIFAVFTIFDPSSFGMFALGKALLPVFAHAWWYVSSYFVLILFVPFINKLLSLLSGRQTVILIMIGLALSTIQTGLQCFSWDAIAFKGGYSPIWLMIMYTVGASIHKYNFAASLKKRWCALIWFSSVLVTFISRIVLALFSVGRVLGVDMLVNYLSPFMVLMAVSILLFFTKVKFPQWLGKIWAFLSPLSFAVYLIHEHPLVKPHLIEGNFAFLASKNPFVMVASIIIIALIIYFICSLIDWIRMLLFKVTRLDYLIQKSGAAIDAKIRLEL